MHLYAYLIRRIGLAYSLIKFCFHIKQEETAPCDVGKLLDEECHVLEHHLTCRVGIAIACLSEMPTDHRSILLWRAGINPDAANSIKSVCYHHEAKFGWWYELRQTNCCQVITKHKKVTKGKHKCNLLR